MIRTVAVKDVFAVNCYFCIDGSTLSGFLIDPGAEAGRIMRIIERNGWNIERILLTHGHFDHTGAVDELSQRLGVPYHIHRNGEQYLKDTMLNLSAYCQRHIVLDEALYFDDGTEFALHANPHYRLQAIHTPGHTPDSVTFHNVDEGYAVVGDTIFRGCPGTTQYAGGNPRQLYASITGRILALPDDTVLYSGHSEPTTVSDERQLYLG